MRFFRSEERSCEIVGFRDAADARNRSKEHFAYKRNPKKTFVTAVCQGGGKRSKTPATVTLSKVRNVCGARVQARQKNAAELSHLEKAFDLTVKRPATTTQETNHASAPKRSRLDEY
mmetsp:Transcript_19831/g.46116  ORF Transcript_19831/g.46116 Transcript_19831/m.46116 type:complete len:117 (-) Transcript_19831:161-511(-)